MTQNLKQLAALAALNDELASPSFSICTLDKVAKMLGVNPKCESYDILHTIHCVHYDKLAPELRDAIPKLIQDCVGQTPAFQFDTTSEVFSARAARLSAAIDACVDAQKPRRGLLRLLGGGS